ncbi:triple tyrosine motif-containing protein [Duganella sp. CT11-25]|uniref:sensor histidine kinase n=1 Tax=unclassified Duganella TaxID=2636909 RepID=UPI0039AF9736
MKLYAALRRAAGALALALGLSGTAAALNPAIRLEDYHHAAWTAKDGAPAEVRALAQTPDGWLWLGAPTGLFRFDGVRFERYELATGGEVAKRRITELRADANGDLWISYSVGGLSVLRKDGRLDDIFPLDSAVGNVMTLANDSDGGTWIAGSTGLYHYARGQLRKLGPGQGLPTEAANGVLLDQYGQLWTINPHGLYRLDRASGKFGQIVAHRSDAGLIQSPDGRLWMIDRLQARAVPPALSVPAGARPLPRAAGFNPAESRWAGQFDRDGNLWTPHCPQALCLVARAGAAENTLLIHDRDATDRQDPQARAARLPYNTLMEDREGNVWVTSQGALERFRENRLIPVRLPQSNGLFSMAGDTEGGVWATNMITRTAWRVSADAPPVPYDGGPVSVVANDRDGALLLAGARAIERRHHGQASTMPLPPGADGKPADLDVLGLQDDGKVLWMASLQTGLRGYLDGGWQPRSAFSLPPRIFLAAAGRKPGERWQATGDATIVFNDNGKLATYDARVIGLATSIAVGEDIVAGGDAGLAIFQGQRFRAIKASSPEVLQNISGMAVTADGDRWFNGGKGVVHVRGADWRAAVANPDALLRYELLDLLDGYPGQAMLQNRLPSVYADRAGQLWFMTSGGIVRLSPSQIRRNAIAPAAQILRVQAGDASYGATAHAQAMRLPPGSSNLSIHFTAPMLGKPEAIRFQYQLSGVNDGWQEAGARRSVDYTNIGAGSYTFRVRAYNEDGLQSTEDAVLAFEIAPTFTQTIWFKALCALASAGLLYLLYLYRLRVETGRLAERMHARMAERERIARTLHDTFLQSVQAMLLRLDLVAAALPDDSEARQKLGLILDQANDTLVEGRDQVHELRTGRVDDVESAAREAGRQLEQEHPGTTHSIAVNGARIKLQSAVAEEACEIVREAMRNAFRHAGAAKVEVRLDYRRDLFALTVSDNGQGMAADAHGKQKHYGLVGMRERAARAGGLLEVVDAGGAAGSGGSGVRIVLTVPARAAYAGGGKHWWQRRRPA